MTKPGKEDTFAIWIAAEPYQYQAFVHLDELELLEPPFLSAPDITSYCWSIHQIDYPSSVYERLKTWGGLINRIFIVTVADERIYWGTFKGDLDSGGCQNPVIMLYPRHPDGSNTIPPCLIIQRAYPDFVGSNDDPDLRNDLRIYRALVEAGILVP
ncbi:MAG: hypothetical protein JSW54_06215 [Fidelibacterota bacterium]|nr:MAG: hypothetical protein JSW54_06215 [Candidatus Neomarinimicrobiota bacterium]